MKPVPAALSLSELWTLKALPAGVLNPFKKSCLQLLLVSKVFSFLLFAKLGK